MKPRWSYRPRGLPGWPTAEAAAVALADALYACSPQALVRTALLTNRGPVHEADDPDTEGCRELLAFGKLQLQIAQVRFPERVLENGWLQKNGLRTAVGGRPFPSANSTAHLTVTPFTLLGVSSRARRDQPCDCILQEALPAITYALTELHMAWAASSLLSPTFFTCAGTVNGRCPLEEQYTAAGLWGVTPTYEYSLKGKGKDGLDKMR